MQLVIGRILCVILMITSVNFAASVVSVKQNGTGFALIRNGQPYYINGAGDKYRMYEIPLNGGNSVRTWGTDDKILDSAAAQGLSLTMGIWDPATAVAAVNKYKNHDALLMWGLGNEIETRTANTVQMWKDVNAIAVQMKAADPNHPIMTAVAEIGGSKIQQIKDNFPALDILGVNSYGGLASLASRLAAAGWTKPYIVTEFGPKGPWEVTKTSWGVPLEPTSTQKADSYISGYTGSIAGKTNCLGSYAFLWGFKQEKTHTWMGMFLQPDIGGGRTAAVDAMTFLWTGAWPRVRCPVIAGNGIAIDTNYNKGNRTSTFATGSTIKCRIKATDPQMQPLVITWDLRQDASLNPTSGGGVEPVNPPLAGAVIAASGDSALIALPLKNDTLRVHVYVHNASGYAATANLPIVVDSRVSISKSSFNSTVSGIFPNKISGERFSFVGRRISSNRSLTQGVFFESLGGNALEKKVVIVHNQK